MHQGTFMYLLREEREAFASSNRKELREEREAFASSNRKELKVGR